VKRAFAAVSGLPFSRLYCVIAIRACGQHFAPGAKGNDAKLPNEVLFLKRLVLRASVGRRAYDAYGSDLDCNRAPLSGGCWPMLFLGAAVLALRLHAVLSRGRLRLPVVGWRLRACLPGCDASLPVRTHRLECWETCLPSRLPKHVPSFASLA
jgi:hypothetical protein